MKGTPRKVSRSSNQGVSVGKPDQSAFTKYTEDSAFAEFREVAYPFEWEGTLLVRKLAGGIPSDPKVAEAWIRSKMGESTDDALRKQVAEVMLERKIDKDEATKLVNSLRHLNGFKRDPKTGLYIEGRQLKAGIKEAANVRWPKGPGTTKGWGPSNKGTIGFFAEHVFVVEDRLPLLVPESDPREFLPESEIEIVQRFVSTFRGTGIQYEEVVDPVEVDFTVITDYEFTPEQWALLWLTGEQQGIGATRSQGFGRYHVIRWERVK